LKSIDLAEFRRLGYLQELNRYFLHRLGLAMAIMCNDDGSETFAGISDHREVPGGVAFVDLTDGDASARASFIITEIEKRAPDRCKLFGGHDVQPIGHKLPC